MYKINLSNIFISLLRAVSSLALAVKSYKIPLLIPFLVLPALFFSCSEETITPNQNNAIDTVNKYDWSLDTIYGYNSKGIYTADSNDVFIASYPTPLYYNGKTYSEINLNDPSFMCDRIAGYDKNNLFFGGGISGTHLGDPIIKKWTNGNITSYTIKSDSGVSISDIFVEGADECWFATWASFKAYHFNNGQITAYSLDRGQNEGSFFRDKSGQLFVFTYKALGGDDSKICYYKFENDSFHFIGTDTTTNNTELSLNIKRCGNDMIRMGKTNVYSFNNSNWIKLCSAINFTPPYYNLGGISKNNFFCYAKSPVGPWQIYIWDGDKWSIEGSQNIYHYLALGAYDNSTPLNINILVNPENGIIFHMRGKAKVK